LKIIAEKMHTDRNILNRILLIRGKKVMIDRDLAELYGVTTKRLNEQVKRNTTRFPEDFIFQLTLEEKNEVVANCDHLKQLKFSHTLPLAFTEHGAVMLACVLNSKRAIEANIRIIRIFTAMREITLHNNELLLKLVKLEQKVDTHDESINLLFEAIKKMIETPPKQRNRIGFIQDE
jgi:hypothetical protein